MKNNIRNINVYTGKRSYIKKNIKNGSIICDMIKDDINIDKNNAIKELYNMILCIIEDYPFLKDYENIIKIECTKINMYILQSTDQEITTKGKIMLLNKLCELFPYLNEIKQDDYINITIGEKQINKKGDITILDSIKSVYEKIIINDGEYYVDLNYDIYDNEHIYCGFTLKDKPYLFCDTLISNLL